MKDNNKIDKYIKEKLSNYSSSVPDTLWDDIEDDLLPKKIPLWQHWSVVAAIALLCVASSVTIFFINRDSSLIINNNNNEIAQKQSLIDKKIDDNKNYINHIIGKENYSEGLKLAQAVVSRNSDSEKISEGQSIDNLADTSKNVVDEAIESIDNKTEEYKDSKRKIQKKYNYNVVKRKKTNSWSIGVEGNTLPVSSSSINDGYSRLKSDYSNNSLMMDSPGMNSRDNVYKEVLFSNITREDVSSNFKHKTPIVFGVSLKFYLDQYWTIMTGISYTILESELTSGSSDSYYKEEQKLHYVGIPLRLGRDIWSNKIFSLYSSAGFEVEKMVSGKLNTYSNTVSENNSERITIDELQWSLSAGVGLQYNIIEGLGIYAEPGIKYYFNDGSDVQTIRKDKPFNFNIQVGFRYTFPKK